MKLVKFAYGLIEIELPDGSKWIVNEIEKNGKYSLTASKEQDD